MITIKDTIQPAYFTKNAVRLFFNLSTAISNGELSTLVFYIGEGYSNGETISFLNSSGINENWVFEDIPGSDTLTDKNIQRYETSELTIVGYFNIHILPRIIACRILENYSLTTKQETPDILSLSFIATAGDSKFDFTTNTDSSMPIGGVNYVVNTAASIYLTADVYVHHQNYIYGEGLEYQHQLAGSLKSTLDKNGDTFLEFSTILNSFLKPKLYLRLDQKTTPFDNVLEANILLKEVNADTQAIISQQSMVFIAVLGGFPTPLKLSTIQEYQYIGGTVGKFLSVTKSEYRVYPKWISAYTYLAPGRDTVRLFSLGIKYYGVEDNALVVKRTIETGDVSDLIDNLIPIVEPIIFNIDELRVDIYPLDTSLTPPLPPDRILTLIVDRTNYENNNFFFFYNSLGGQDLAWFTGDIAVTSEADMTESSETVVNSDYNFTVANRQKGVTTTTYKINTGLKTLEEIQWMKEIVQSEKIAWFNKENFEKLVDTIYDTPPKNVKYLYIIPINKEIELIPSENQMFSFDMEFEIAIDSPSNINY